MNLNEILSIREEFHNRKLLYENREIFHEIEEEKEIEENVEYKEINDSIVKGSELLKNNIIDYNKILIEKKKFEDLLKNVKNAFFDIQGKTDYIKTICDYNKLEIENLQDMLDQINYSGICIQDKVEEELKKQKEQIDIKAQKSKKTLKSLSKAYNVLRNTSVSFICPICINNQVDVFCDPCGHSFCKTCVSKSSHFFFCRHKINKIAKLFFML